MDDDRLKGEFYSKVSNLTALWLSAIERKALQSFGTNEWNAESLWVFVLSVSRKNDNLPNLNKRVYR